MIYSGKFGGFPSTGSRDICGTRICHADADTDADTIGIRMETNMSPSPLVGWEHNLICNQINSNSFRKQFRWNFFTGTSRRQSNNKFTRQAHITIASKLTLLSALRALLVYASEGGELVNSSFTSHQ